MKDFIKKQLRKRLLENSYQDIALDKIQSVGGFDNLPELDKLVLLSVSGDVNKLKNISLTKIYHEKGGTFDHLKIEVKVKDINQQPIDHKFSKEFAGKEGYLFSYIHYSDENEAYATVRFKGFIPNSEYKGEGSYNDIPIMLDNLFPIGYGDIDAEFVKYKNKIDLERKEFRDKFNLDNED